jgi:hypothetical protein
MIIIRKKKENICMVFDNKSKCQVKESKQVEQKEEIIYKMMQRIIIL